jgi:hypothetical protein
MIAGQCTQELPREILSDRLPQTQRGGRLPGLFLVQVIDDSRQRWGLGLRGVHARTIGAPASPGDPSRE